MDVSGAGTRRKKIKNPDAIAVFIAVFVIGIILVALPTLPYLFPQNSEADQEKILHDRKLMIEEALESGSGYYDSNRSLYHGITLLKKKTPDGQGYYSAKLKPGLSERIPAYVASYNADPNTLYPVTEEEVRYGLTDGLHETVVTGENEAAYRLRLFFNWCNYQIWAGTI